MARKININRQLLGLEDILFGEGTETQTRNGQEVVITKINAGNLPFDETQTLLEWAQNTDLDSIVQAIPAITSIYGNLNELLNLDETFIEISEKIDTFLNLSITITTLPAGQDALVEYNAVTGVLHFSIPQGDTGPKGDTGDTGPKGDTGDTGPKGDTGISITSVTRTSGNGSPGTTDTYTITFSDNSTSTFQVYNGANGSGSGDMEKATYDTNNNGIVDNAQMLTLDLANTLAPTEGQIKWNIVEGTADLGLQGGSILQIGQENVRTVRNSTASTISNGRLCMFNGTIGNIGRIKVKPFTAGFNEALYLYGVATQNILAGTDGIITIEGKVRGIDTTGVSVGEVWQDEDILYAKPNDTGRMTNIEPADNELKLVVATVIHAHSTNGCLEIRFRPFNENMYYTKVQIDSIIGDINSAIDSINGEVI